MGKSGLTRRRGKMPEGNMPTLFRLIVVLAIIGALAGAAMMALATMVTPTPREIISTVQLPPQGK